MSDKWRDMVCVEGKVGFTAQSWVQQSRGNATLALLLKGAAETPCKYKPSGCSFSHFLGFALAEHQTACGFHTGGGDGGDGGEAEGCGSDVHVCICACVMCVCVCM